MSELRARSAGATDWAAIEALLIANALPVEGAQAHLASFFVMFDDADLVGAVGIERYGSVALLRSVAVRQSHQNQGIGRHLVETAERGEVGFGVDTLYLLTTTATLYFKKRGYVIVDRGDVPVESQSSAEFRSACPANATCMRRHLL